MKKLLSSLFVLVFSFNANAADCAMPQGKLGETYVFKVQSSKNMNTLTYKCTKEGWMSTENDIYKAPKWEKVEDSRQVIYLQKCDFDERYTITNKTAKGHTCLLKQ